MRMRVLRSQRSLGRDLRFFPVRLGVSLVAVASVLAVALTAQASPPVSKSVTGFFGATGTGAGQLTTPRGVAVNQTTGNVYAVDGGNNRVVEFNSNGEFQRAFGQDVVASGPDNNGTGFEVCVPVSGDVCKAGVTGATGGAMSTPQGIAVNQETGNVYVTDGTNLRIDEYSASGSFIAAFGQAVVASGPDLVTAASAVQTLTVTATGGKYTLTFGGKTTGELAFNANAAAIQTALTGLASIGAGNATVIETSAGIYTITFAGALANNPEPLITATSASSPNELAGGTASVANTTTGATGYDVCVAVNGDVCKAGTSASTGGAFKSTFNGYPAVAPAGAPNAGDVLVADPANLRVQEFTASGAFVRAFGFNAVAAGPDNNGTTNFEICTSANGDACGISATGAGNGQFATNALNRVAEDSAGDIYTVESSANFRVQKFTLPSNVVTPQGAFDAAELSGTSTANGPTDVAVDPATSDVLVTKAFATGATASCPATGTASVAERRVLEVSSTGVLQATHMVCAGINVANGLAVSTSASTGNVYVSSTTTESRLYVLNTPLIAPTDAITNISGITAHSAAVSGYVNPNGPAALPYGLHVTYHVGYKRSVDAAFTAAPNVDIDAGRGTNNVVVSQTISGLEAGTSYEVQIVATRAFNGPVKTAIFTFTTPSEGPEAGVPTATAAATETGARAALYGSVSSNSQATTYRFEYGTSTSYGASVPTPDGSVNANANATPVAQYISDLLPETTYHYRLVAKNASGAVTSADQTFTTPPAWTNGSGAEACPNQKIREEQHATGLSDCRAYELVSPAEKGASGYIGTFLTGGAVPYQAAPEGDSFFYPIVNGAPNATAGGTVFYIAHRGSAEWQSTQATAPTLVPFPYQGSTGNENNGTSLIQYNSSDLSCTILESFEPLSSGSVAEEGLHLGVRNLYRRNSDGSYTLISNQLPLNPAATVTISFYHVDWASADCSHILFESTYWLLPNAPRTVEGEGTILYEWSNGALRVAQILPSGGVDAKKAEAGSKQAVVNTMSSDGAKVIFTTTSSEGPDSGQLAIFVRSNGSTTVDISQSQTSIPNNGSSLFEGALADDSQIYFLARYGLASQSSTGATACQSESAGTRIGTGCDLYDYSTNTGTLSDLSVDMNPADVKGASVPGMVAASEDGSYVYFAARGQLIPGQGQTEAENNTNKNDNLYLNHLGHVTFVGPITAKEVEGTAGVTGSDIEGELPSWAANVTPDGRHLLFVSSANVTGYGAGTPEAYLYSAEADTTVCVSCRPDGLPSSSATYKPIGFRGTMELSVQQGKLPPVRPNSLSEDGSRVFFTSPEALVPGSGAGLQNIYEWHNGQIGLIASNSDAHYISSSASGRDVYFVTAAKLAPEDLGFSSDVYDARAGGGFPYTPSPASCDPLSEGSCQESAGPAPLFTSPPSLSFSGLGNDPISPPVAVPKVAPKPSTRTQKLTQAQKLKKALKICKKKPKRKRPKCEKSARKTYGRSK